MGSCCVFPVLFWAAVFALLGPTSGHYSLLYQIKVISQDGFIEPGFLAEGYLNGKPYLHYDHKKDRAEPRGPWAEAHLGAETWDAENKDLTDMGKKLRMTLSDIMKLQDQKGGLHSFQEMLHCEIQEDYSSMGIWDYCYDGEPFLSYDPGTQRWTVPLSSTQTLALEIKKTWDTDGDKHKYYHHHVQGDICKRLRSYSTSGRNFMERTVPPAVNVTVSKAVKGNVTLMCRAAGFYPRKITLTWLQDGEPLSTDSQNHGCILPDGNGTYETWVSTRLPQGEEQRYSCQVEHSGKNVTQPVSNGGSSVQESGVLKPIVLAAVGVLAVAAIVFVLWRYKKEKSPDVESPEHEQLQDSHRHQKATGDQNGTMELGSHPLLSDSELVGSTGGPKSLQPSTLDSTPC